MAEKALTSLVVRARSLEWVVTGKSADKSVPPAAITAELDPGVDQKNLLGGLQADSDRMVNEIREKCGRLPAPVYTGIPASWVLLRIADLPSGSPDELSSMAELQIDKFSPFPVEESSCSYELLSEQDGRCRVLLSAIRTHTLDVLADGLRAAGIQPKWIDINLLGWWRLLSDAGKLLPSGTQVFILLEGPDCDIIVATAGVPVAMRSLSGMDELPWDEADEEIARETLYTLTSLNLDREGSHLAELSLWYRGEPPEGLVRRFTGTVPVVPRLNALESLPPLAAGLLRRAESRTRTTLDLAPRAWQEAETARQTRKRVVVSSLIVAGLWLLGMAVLFGGIQVKKQGIASLEGELADLKGPAEKVRAIRDRTQELIKYMDRSRSALECLREISELLPAGIELKSFNYHKNKSLEMTGEAESYSLVADFKKALEPSPLFVATALPRTQHTPQGKESFKIICTMPGGEKP